MRVDVCWLDSITRSFSTEVPTYLPGYLRVLVQVWRDEPVLRGAVAAAARVSELRAARETTGREHAAAITMREQENAGLRAEFVQHRHEQGGVQEQLEADRRALSGRVASLQEQAAQLEREKHEGTEEIEHWRKGKISFVRGRGLGGCRLGPAAAQQGPAHASRLESSGFIELTHDREVEQRSSSVGTKRRSSFAA